MTPQEENRRWKNYKEEVARRFKEPKKHPTFIFYFIVAILIGAGIGVLIPVAKLLIQMLSVGYQRPDAVSIVQSLTTYAIAISATAFVDLLLTINDGTNKVANNPIKNSIAFTVIIAFAFVIAFTLWTYTPMRLMASSCLAVVGTALALMIWWIANADNSKLLEAEPSPNAATGGNTEKPAGNLEDLMKKGLN